MRVLSFLSLLCAALCVSGALRTRQIDLRLDHFNPLDRRTFEGRYFVNSEFYTAGGPIFIYVSASFEVYDEFLTRGNVFDIARELEGHLFSLEHRYLGTSRPTNDTSLANLQWLSPQQAVADLAQFINFIKSNYYGTQNSPVILWGRGLGGSYAIWARQKYPHLVNGAWGSSAHLNAILEFPQFMRSSFNTFNTIGGERCGNIFRGAFSMIDAGIRNRNTSYVEERMRLCSPIDFNDENDLTRLFYGLASDIGYSFVSNAAYSDIAMTCATMTGQTDPGNLPENDLDAFARWFVDDYNRNLQCLEYRNELTLNRYRQVAWDTVSTIAGRRQLFWLQCVHFGQFPVSNRGDDHAFGWRFEASFFRQWCSDVFGADILTDEFIDESIAATNTHFGGLNPGVYRVIMTHGEMDPRNTLGPSEDINVNSPVIVMSLQSFGRDLGSVNDTDYIVLQQTKERVRDTIIEWIITDAVEETSPPPTTTSDPIPAK